MTLDDPNQQPHGWRKLRLSLGKRVPKPAVAILGAVSTVCGTMVGFSAWWLIPTIAFLLMAGAAHSSREAWLRHEEETRAASDKDAQVALEESATTALEKLASDHGKFADVFSELARSAADMADKNKTDRAADFAVLVKQAVAAIAWVVHGDIPGIRAVVYQVSDDDTQMEVVAWTPGNFRSAPQPFIRGTDRGDKAFATLRGGESLFVDDISKAPEQWAGSGVGYNTFITTPIVSPTVGFGLLTVDAPETDSLTEDDENDLRLIAGILAMIFAEKTRRTPGRSPSGTP